MDRFPLRPCLIGVALFAVTGTVVVAQTGTEPPSARAALTLEDVLAAAMTQHPLIESARARVEAARGDRRTAGTVPNPVVTFSVEGTSFVPGLGQATRLDPERFAYVTFPIESLFQRRPRADWADAEIRAAEAELAVAERRVARDVSRTFYRVALAQVAVTAAEENRSAVDRLVDYLRIRVAQGASPEAELIRAEVERGQTATDVTLAEVDLLRARAELQPYLAGPAPPLNTLRALVPEPLAASPPLPAMEEFVQRASQRSELLSARARVAATVAAVAVEQNLAFREIGASFGVKRTSGINSMIAGVSLSVPIFDRNRGQVDRATAQRLAAEHELAWIERTMAAELNGAYEVAQRLAARVSELRPGFLSRAEESSRITVAAYQEGAATLLQVLDATRTLASARLSYSRAVLAARESHFELMIAAGYDAATAARRGGRP